MTDNNMQEISRRPAQSGKVSYADAVLLHDSSRTRVVMVPFFVPHSDHTELAVKLVTYSKEPAPHDWALVQNKSLSLKEAPARKLLAALKAHLAVAAETADGEYIAIRVAEGTAQIGDHDPAVVANALSKALGQPGIVEHLRDVELGEHFAGALRGAIRLSEMRAAMAQLRELLASDEQTESTYQKWCEKHSWAFGNAYVMRDEIREIAPGDTLDILLQTVISGYREIVELKRPDKPVLQWDERHRNYYFSSEVSKAIGQCHRYIDVLHEAAAQGLDDHPEVVAYHPRAIIVIGRSADWSKEQARGLHGLNHRLSGIVVMTYDQLMAQGERLVEILGAESSSDYNVDELQADDQVLDAEDYAPRETDDGSE